MHWLLSATKPKLQGSALWRGPNPITLVTIHQLIEVLVDADKEGQGLCAAECASEKSLAAQSQKGLPASLF